MTLRHREPARREGPGCALAAVLALALVLVASAAWARPLSDQEKADLAATVQSFDAAMREDNYMRVTQTVPPKVIGAIARRAGATPEAVVAAMITQMQQTLQGGDVKIESFAMNLGAALYKELPSGMPYVLLPTETVIAVAVQGRVRARSHTLALLDEGKWFLLRVSDDRQVEILREAYPEFTSVELPRGSTEILKSALEPMSANLLALLYLAAAVLFIMVLRGLSSQEASRRGNLLAMYKKREPRK